MIAGIGIDSIDIDRFAQWHTYARQKLQRIFSTEEITYCLQNKKKSAERFAVRFAAREALFKAMTMYAPQHNIPFLTLCKLITVQKSHTGAPMLRIDWNILSQNYNIKPITPFITLTHTHQIATAWVMLQYNHR